MSRLDEIKARADAATEGPWVRDMHSPDMSGRSGWYIRGPRKLGLRSMVLNSRMLPGDAEFVEAAREDVPWLVDQVESLERWKFEACEVMSGLRELGRALGLRPGVQVTGPAALAEVERLTRVIDAKPRQPLVVLNEYLDRTEKAEAEVERLTAERDALIAVGKRQAARLARVEALAEEWDGDDSCDNRTCVPHRSADALRAALAGSEADTSDTHLTTHES